MDDELHATAFIEEALEDDILLSRDEADAVAFGADVADELFGGFSGEVAFASDPADGIGPGHSVDPPLVSLAAFCSSVLFGGRSFFPPTPPGRKTGGHPQAPSRAGLI